MQVNRKGVFTLYFLLMPSLILVLIFGIYPTIYNFILSLKDVNLITYIRGTAKFVGLSNYSEIFRNSLFWKAVFNTLIFTVLSIFFQLIIGFLLALLFNHDFPLKGVLQALIMIPWVMPIMVSGTYFRWVFSDNGFLNNLLASWGLIQEPIRWITSEKLAIYSLAIANIWLGIPFNFILLYTGLQEIPEELYESADIDGASSWEKVIYITIPLLKPVIITALILGCIFTMKVFDLVWIVTKGGPGGASHVFSTFSYSLAFDRFRFGESAAVVIIMLVIVTVLVGLMSRIRVEEG
ncbi:MAG: sugar ABC transporter permease [Thermotogaceae bacterium]|nr:sugar ABC transporter permease [Thermotogaceae bacterium]